MCLWCLWCGERVCVRMGVRVDGSWWYNSASYVTVWYLWVCVCVGPSTHSCASVISDVWWVQGVHVPLNRFAAICILNRRILIFPAFVFGGSFWECLCSCLRAFECSYRARADGEAGRPRSTAGEVGGSEGGCGGRVTRCCVKLIPFPPPPLSLSFPSSPTFPFTSSPKQKSCSVHKKDNLLQHSFLCLFVGYLWFVYVISPFFFFVTCMEVTLRGMGWNHRTRRKGNEGKGKTRERATLQRWDNGTSCNSRP